MPRCSGRLTDFCFLQIPLSAQTPGRIDLIRAIRNFPNFPEQALMLLPLICRPRLDQAGGTAHCPLAGKPVNQIDRRKLATMPESSQNRTAMQQNGV
jgi:hypothetical protein